MSDILNKNCVLVTNSLWQCVGTTTPKKSFIAINSSIDSINMAVKFFDIQYKKNQDGSYNFDEVEFITPLTFEEWEKVEIRPFDEVIKTANRIFRIPNVICAMNFHKIPVRTLRPTKKNLFYRYGGKCAYTNKQLTLNSMTTDHIIPKSRWKELKKFGSADSWENLVPCDKDLNHKKGNSLNEEIGLKLLVKPSSPKPIPVSELISEIRHRDWAWFLHK